MADRNDTARLEAFCDGVFAIALTLLIIDVKLPSEETIGSAPELWRALQRLTPSVLAFTLSFGIILITWVNHHAALKLVNKASAPFIYANGFLLLTVVFIPFPTSLLGAFLLTDHAAPAVVLYDAVLAAQAIGWVLMSGTALNGGLANGTHSASTIHGNRKNGYSAFALYGVLAVTALWFPLIVAAITTLTWIVWLVLSVRVKHA
jgi:uncharacterized membrane protein